MSRFDCCESLSRILYRQSLKQTVKVNNLAEEFSALLLESNAGECTLNVPRLSSEIKRARPPFLTASARYDYDWTAAATAATAGGRAGARGSSCPADRSASARELVNGRSAQ